jgi:fluoride ion exporter CrcB/FEX
MQVEVLRMIDQGRLGLAAAYAAASIAAGYVAIWWTTAVVRRSRLIA